MTTLTTNRVATTGFSGFIAAITGTLSAWNDSRVTRNALSKLSDRELDDIGLCRGDIEDIATGN